MGESEGKMAPVIVVISPGEMGGGVAQRLRLRGASVRTSLRGRGAASAARAKSAGLEVIDEDAALIAEADMVLSILPPGDAVALAQRLAPVLRASAKKPVYVDCNAISPATLAAVAAVIAPTGCPFVDIGIIGSAPPREGNVSPRLYASGAEARRIAVLKDFGLDLRLIEGDIGAASALKMSYATLTKGGQAIGIAMMLGAMRNGTAAALRAEIAASQPGLAKWLGEQVPRIYPKAYRWVAEMEEIAKFLAADPGAAQMLAGAALLYAQMAKDAAARGGEGNIVDLCEAFLERE
jgi:3-hydroxyisobutyrate dehydrogenase-like beta-hydroxyacid dehydrogenase